MARKSIKNRVGRCFELNYKHVIDNREYFLVHGYITNITVNPPVTIAHAWCKKGDEIYDAVLDTTFKSYIYEYLYQAQERYVYSADEAQRASMTDDTYGSWEEL